MNTKNIHNDNYIYENLTNMNHDNHNYNNTNNNFNLNQNNFNFNLDNDGNNNNFYNSIDFNNTQNNFPLNHNYHNPYLYYSNNTFPKIFNSAINSPWKSNRVNNPANNFYNANENLSNLNNDSFSSKDLLNLSFTEDNIKKGFYYTPGSSPNRASYSKKFMNNSFSNSDNLFNKKPNLNNQPFRKTSSLFVNNFEKDEKAEEFKDLEELLATIECEFWLYAKSQKGSRNLQKLLNKILPSELDTILEKVKEYFYELMTDTYGNYFCQKLIQCCSSEQRIFILKYVMLLKFKFKFNHLVFKEFFKDYILFKLYQ